MSKQTALLASGREEKRENRGRPSHQQTKRKEKKKDSILYAITPDRSSPLPPKILICFLDVDFRELKSRMYSRITINSRILLLSLILMESSTKHQSREQAAIVSIIH